jgi:PAS domain S-box-containing protein
MSAHPERAQDENHEGVLSSENLLKLMVESVRDYGIFMLDTKGHVISWNIGAERIKGYKAEEIIGSHFSIFFAKEDVEANKPERELMIATKEGRYEEEGWRVRKDGTTFWASIVVTAVRDNHGVLRGFGKVTRDMTERMRNEEKIRALANELEERVMQRTRDLETSNKELESFSYSVSHDLRAPVRAMNGFARILLDEHSQELSKEAREYLSIISESARQMGNLVDDLIEFSRLGRRPVYKTAVNTRDLLDSVLETLRPSFEGRNIELVIGELPEAYADPILLRQVFLNLVSNALKYSSNREHARIEIGALSHHNDKTVYFVRDNGVGFNMKYAHKLFEVFQRLHRAEDYEGTGVGLAIVSRVIQRHEVWAEAEEGRGATFFFSLNRANI